MQFLKIFLSIFVIALTTSVARAEVKVYTIDPSHTNILWFGSHFGFSYSVGQFMDFEGKIEFDEANPANSYVEVVIQADSVMTGLDNFDEKLRSDVFFDANAHPTIRFTSKEMVIQGKDRGEIVGDLTLKGVTRPVILKTVLNKAGINPYNEKETLGFRAETVLRRADFNMDNMVDKGIAPIVPILIEMEAIFDEEATRAYHQTEFDASQPIDLSAISDAN